MVGGAMYRYFKKKMSVEVVAYDKGKNEGSIKEVNEADIIFICVPTPWKEKHFDTSIVEEAIGYLKESKVIVIKSTVSIGTTRKLQEKFPQHTIIFNPEFLTEQTADQDMNYPDRQIIGYCNKKGYRISKDILDILPLAQCERIVPAEEAEAELLRGIDLDPRDPTPHLYLAALKADDFRPGEAVLSYFRALDLNDNRLVERSSYLLDGDRAVKNINMAWSLGQLGLFGWAGF